MKRFLFVLLFSLSLQAEVKPDLRSQIGSTFSAPVAWGNNYYFVATTGVLYEANKDFSAVAKLYEGKKQSLGTLLLHQDKLIWGEGVHTDSKVTLHIFDLKTKKLFKDIPVDGHIERAPLATKGLILLPLGSGGIQALKEKDLSPLWHTKEFNGKKLHVDSNMVEVGNKVCVASIYETKGIVCFDPKNGKITQMAQLKRNPKSELVTWKGHVVGFATEGDLTTPKWDIPGDLFVYDVEKDKFKMLKELRGFNFFAPVIEDDFGFVTLSTGDFLLINLNDGKIHFMGEFPEPFINSPFIRHGQYCGIGIMGKLMCYSKTKSDFALAVDRRLLETVVGKISVFDGNIVAPSRIGYALIKD